MIDQLEKIEIRFNEINDLLTRPETITDQNQFRTLSKERSNAEAIVDKYRTYRKLLTDIEGNKDILYNSDDPELREMARTELNQLELD